jgi:glycosyltransferase involved in cell wall biosynthesis
VAGGRGVTLPAGRVVDTSRVREKICFVVSSPMTADAFLAGHIRTLSERYEVHFVLNGPPESVRHPDLQHTRRFSARIEREIAPFADVAGLVQLTRILRRGGYSAVHSLTPKAGLLTAIAAFAARVPVRLHTYTGQVWATRKGARRRFLKAFDVLIAKLDTHVLADSLSQRDFLRSEGVLARDQGIVLAKGSVCGVDAERFRPDDAARTSVRAALGIAPDALVFLFVGRLTHDKGVLDLAHAFSRLALLRENTFLVLVGPDEDGTSAGIREACATCGARVRFVGYTQDPERYMAASDVFCLPSHREGFGSVVVEAAAAGLPAIGSRIYGIVDAIEDGRTGLLVEPANPGDLAAAMQRLADDAVFRQSLGKAARERALKDFSQAALTGALLEFYGSVLHASGSRRGKPA